MSTVASFSAILRASETSALRFRIDRHELVRHDAMRQLPPRHVDQRLRIEGLDDVVRRALAHGGDRLRDGAVGRHQHDRQIRPQALDRGQELVAVGPGHLHVGDDQGDLLARRQLQRARRIVRGQRRAMPAALQRVDQRLAQCGIVLDHQNRFIGRCSCQISSAGKSMMKVAPRRDARRADAARVRLDHGLDDGKPDAVAARTGGEERLEDPLANMRGHAGTVVAHHDLRRGRPPRGAPAARDPASTTPPAARWWPDSAPRRPATAHWRAPSGPAPGCGWSGGRRGATPAAATAPPARAARSRSPTSRAAPPCANASMSLTSLSSCFRLPTVFSAQRARSSALRPGKLICEAYSSAAASGVRI